MPLLPEIVIDSFAGGGGASEGIEMAMRRMEALGLLPEGVEPIVNFAINHDRKALAMHAANHPRTVHLPCDIFTADPIAVCGRNPVGLLWASPDCRHHSKAKGGKPVSASVRALANAVVNWAELVSPRIIALENVEEFMDWGPLVAGPDGSLRPDPARKGLYFKRWVRRFTKLGYRVDWRVSRACNRGAPTIRRRLFVIMRRDGEPILWAPESHGDPKSEDVKAGRVKPWRTAAEIVDWDLPCPSILMSKADAKAYGELTGKRIIRPLAENSERRIAQGIRRYVLDDPEPFVVTCNHSGNGFRGQGMREPFATVTKARDGHGLVVPCVVGVGGRMGQSNPRPVNKPWHTCTTKPDSAIVAGHLMTMRNSGKPWSAGDDPCHTVTAGGAGLSAVVARFGVKHTSGGVGFPLRNAVPTVTANSFVKRSGGASPLGWGEVSLAASYVVQHTAGTHPGAPGRLASQPISTVTGAGSQQGVVAAHMLSLKGTERRACGICEPHAAITAGGQHSAVVSLPILNAYYGNDQHGAGLKDPCRTVSTRDHFSLIDCPGLVPPMTAAQAERARQVAAFLRRYDCWDDREFVTVTIAGVELVLADIGMRMLTPRELARAQGFRDSYVLDAPYFDPKTKKQKRLTETDQRHKIGNSVCPDEAEAHIFANYRPQLLPPVERDGWMLADGWDLQPMEAAE